MRWMEVPTRAGASRPVLFRRGHGRTLEPDQRNRQRNSRIASRETALGAFLPDLDDPTHAHFERFHGVGPTLLIDHVLLQAVMTVSSLLEDFAAEGSAQ